MQKTELSKALKFGIIDFAYLKDKEVEYEKITYNNSATYDAINFFWRSTALILTKRLVRQDTQFP
jgi:hypothetical protein